MCVMELRRARARIISHRPSYIAEDYDLEDYDLDARTSVIIQMRQHRELVYQAFLRDKTHGFHPYLPPLEI